MIRNVILFMGIFLLIGSFAFALMVNAHFHSDFFPETIEEAAYDILAAMATSVGFLFVAIWKIMQKLDL